MSGGSRGIGKACALVLAQEGCKVGICARGKEALDEVAEEIRALGVEVLAVEVDITNIEDIAKMVAATVEKFGRVDILAHLR